MSLVSSMSSDLCHSITQRLLAHKGMRVLEFGRKMFSPIPLSGNGDKPVPELECVVPGPRSSSNRSKINCSAHCDISFAPRRLLVECVYGGKKAARQAEWFGLRNNKEGDHGVSLSNFLDAAVGLLRHASGSRLRHVESSNQLTVNHAKKIQPLQVFTDKLSRSRVVNGV